MKEADDRGSCTIRPNEDRHAYLIPLGTALEHTQTGSTVEKVFHNPGVEDVQRDLTRTSIQRDGSRTCARQTTFGKANVVARSF